MTFCFRYIAVTLLLGSGMLSSAQAAMTWTVTTRGTIAIGRDANGLFGVAGRDLAGLSYIQSITAVVDPAQWERIHTHDDWLLDMYGLGPGFTNRVTVDGVTLTFVAASTISGSQMLSDYVSTGHPRGYVDYLYSDVEGYAADGTHVYAVNMANSNTVAFIPMLDFSQTIHQTLGPDFIGYAAFSAGDDNPTYFGASLIDSIEMNVGDVQDVPEPASLALLGLGLAALVSARRFR